MENYPLVSMIIPVYNADYYLPRLFKSLKNQTYPNLEIIIVNDGSGDDTKELCEEFAKKQKNVRVITQQNAGVSMARNRGMDEANGKYLMFCDADDWYMKDGVRILVEKIESCHADFCFGGIIKLGVKQKRHISAIKTFDSLNTPEERMEYYTMLGSGVSVYAKMFKREYVERIGLQFAQGMKFSEDTMFVYQYLPQCEKFCCTEQPVYYYSQLPSNNACRKYYRLMSSWAYNVNIFYMRNVMSFGLSDERVHSIRCVSFARAFANACRHYGMGKDEEEYGRHLNFLREAVEIFSEELPLCSEYFNEHGTLGADESDVQLVKIALTGNMEELSKASVRSYEEKINQYSNDRAMRIRKKVLPFVMHAVYRLNIGYND